MKISCTRAPEDRYRRETARFRVVAVVEEQGENKHLKVSSVHFR